MVLSTGTIPYALGREYHDLDAVLDGVRRLCHPSVELVLHPDWRGDIAPRTRQPSEWSESQNLAFADIADHLARVAGDISIASVHGNRDLGAFLSSRDKADQRTGQTLLWEHLSLTRDLDADVLVVHAWDPQDPDPALDVAGESIRNIALSDRSVTVAVENIPTNRDASSQPASLERIMRTSDRIGMALDLSWATHHAHFGDLIAYLERVVNVHVQGYLHHDGQHMHMLTRGTDVSILPAIYELLSRGYRGQWTLELNRVRRLGTFVAALSWLEREIFGKE